VLKGNDQKRIAVYYEHPEWFKPLFAELDHRRISYERLLASAFQYDPKVQLSPYSLIVNRMSPSAHTRARDFKGASGWLTRKVGDPTPESSCDQQRIPGPCRRRGTYIPRNYQTEYRRKWRDDRSL